MPKKFKLILDCVVNACARIYCPILFLFLLLFFFLFSFSKWKKTFFGQRSWLFGYCHTKYIVEILEKFHDRGIQNFRENNRNHWSINRNLLKCSLEVHWLVVINIEPKIFYALEKNESTKCFKRQNYAIIMFSKIYVQRTLFVLYSLEGKKKSFWSRLFYTEYTPKYFAHKVDEIDEERKKINKNTAVIITNHSHRVNWASIESRHLTQ